ncbi:hypothetical protein C7B65_26270 [Phormidesmis priestleyi ULC007]|uniref:Uncharacterized protein n=1 Tax=Phormidesmis priestleyi ULC007 TaxID=1920490 RepID=A0A2T1D259_9CYAN|nr:hypothetical protein [Phormidesmis priestleyi]PSB14556.1 hypothetical protein C7B65_26270 [Phormidesmis priestleyi ULC007]PZO50033.1 MAG: hypothetical protein DCF14_12915 [Phormidesmis priestleyi]
MDFEVIHPVESPDHIRRYREIIRRAIEGNTGKGQLQLIKQAGWIAVPTHIGDLYAFEDEDRLIQTLLDHGYQEFIAVDLSKMQNVSDVLIIPATVLGMEDFKYNIFGWYVWFAGKPDWFILMANTLDFIIVAGQPDFVRRVLGCEPEQASIDIREMSESEYLDPVVRKYYAHLLEQLQITYLQSEPGTIVNLGLLDWDETPSA